MGSVVISVDAELGWGFHDKEAPTSRVEAARSGWKRLAQLFDEYDVPATWAIVGHLLLEDCDGRHEDHPAGPEWFEREREEWATRPDLRFGSDLVERIVTASVDHDIGCHTFSHVLFGDSETTRETASAELELAIAAGKRAGLHYSSFVFPRNNVGHRDLLAEYGFETYRGRRTEHRSTTRKFAEATVLNSDPKLVAPARDEYGLVNIPASLFLFGFEGRARRAVASVFEDPIVEHARSGIDAASRSDGIFHMWLHPNNLVAKRDVRRIETILSYLEESRPEITVETMADVADRIT